MTQAIGNSQIQAGSIVRTGMTSDGRVMYSIMGDDGMPAGKVSLPQDQSHKFERSYDTLMKTAPEMQKLAQKYSDPEEVKSMKKKTGWTIGIITAAGGLIPAALTRGNIWKQLGFTLLGTAAGLFAGIFTAMALFQPKDLSKFQTAAQNISKLDIRPEGNADGQNINFSV